MGGEYNYAGNWLFATGVSLVFHIVLVAALLGFNSTQEKKPVVAEPVKSAAVESNAVARATVSPVNPPETKVPPAVKAPPKFKETPEVKEPSTAKEPPKAKVNETPSPDEVETETYVVRAGDTLSKIAKRCSCTLDELAKLNGKSIKALSRLQVGQKIRVKHSQD